MSPAGERAAIVALLRLAGRSPQQYAALLEQCGNATQVLVRELSEGTDGQPSLLAADPEPLLARAEAELGAWQQRGLKLLTVLDSDYPENLRLVHDRPPLLFVAGELIAADRRSVAVVGSRRASSDGLDSAARVAVQLVSSRFTVVSGLAAGIDTAAHVAALGAGGRTVAVIGTGHGHCYPPRNAGLQRQIASRCAVVSQFWPESPPTREAFPMRNAVMSGLARATVVIEASARSGARIQARLALAHGRPVFLIDSLLSQAWARELAARPGVHIAQRPEQITATLARIDAGDDLHG
ncbi:MAG: DNA-processing protein DprA [Solirubrobacteraceae bacterium]